MRLLLVDEVAGWVTSVSAKWHETTAVTLVYTNKMLCYCKTIAMYPRPSQDLDSNPDRIRTQTQTQSRIRTWIQLDSDLDPDSEPNAWCFLWKSIQRGRPVTIKCRILSTSCRLLRCSLRCAVLFYTIRYDTRCYFNVRSKANISQLNLPHGTDN